MPEFNAAVNTEEKQQDIVFHGHEGKIMCMGKNYAVVDSGNVAINVRVPGLREIDYVIHPNLHRSRDLSPVHQ